MFQRRRRRRRNDECGTSSTTISASSSITRKGSAYTGLMCWWLCVVFQQTESFHVSNFVVQRSSRNQYPSIQHVHQPTTSFRRRTTTTKRIKKACAGPPSFSSFCVASTSTGEETILTRQKLESLTVKDLRQMIKDSKYNERGILSKLKLKKDLVEFLNDKMGNKGLDDSSSPTIPESNGQIATTSTTTKPLRMPSSTKVKIAVSKKAAIQKQQQETDGSTSDHINDDSFSTAAAPSPPTTVVSPKDTLFDRVYERYPTILTENCTGVGEEDVRQQFHPMLKEFQVSSSHDMDIVFVGTASCTPGVSRGVSCTALRLNWKRRSFHVPELSSSTSRAQQNNGQQQQRRDDERMVDMASSFSGGTWLFDCGECTQLQVQRTSSIKPSKITKIFITHAHGDHSFGLPGLLCLMGQDRDRGAQPVDIYGPEGLRMWLRVAIRYSVSRIVPPYRVHEIKDVPMAPEWDYSRRSNRFYYNPKNNKREWGTQGFAGEDPQSWISRANMMDLEPNFQYGEIDGGRDIFPRYDHPDSFDGAPVWEIEDEDDVSVYAAPMSHGIPCLGYVVQERTQPGRLRHEYVKPIVERNLDALKEQGFRIPMKAMAVIKNLPVGSAFTFPDGTVVTQEDAVEPPRKGRKVVICGDSCNCRALSVLAWDADVLVHEATNSYLTGVDKDTNLRTVTRDAVVHGHSTPHMAGDFARRINAKRLVLNHFSARYKGDQSVDSMSLMMRIEEQAIKASGLNTTNVAAAWDMMVLPVPRK